MLDLWLFLRAGVCAVSLFVVHRPVIRLFTYIAFREFPRSRSIVVKYVSLETAKMCA